jgi:mono/diheme cytochrome c family protein
MGCISGEFVMKLMVPIVAAVMLAQPLAAQDAREGADLYEQFCATCHGVGALGDGPMAGVLTVKPKNLTQLQAGNGGVFPVARVVRRIDGRDPLVSHGSPMPVYGHFFEGRDVAAKTDSGQPILTSKPIVDLLAYLRSIQDE